MRTVGGERSKYSVEYSIVSNCTQVSVLAPAHLKGAADRHPSLKDSHIYAICTRPRVTVPKGGIVIDDETMKVTFVSHFRGAKNEITFERPNSFGIPGLRAVTEWPHAEVIFLDGDGEVRLRSLAAILLTSMASDYPLNESVEIHENFLDLDVVYIGRSYGDCGNRNAVGRLTNHETLQQVQADVAVKRPDLDVWLMPMAFKGYSMIGEFGLWIGDASESEEMEHAEELDRCPIPEVQRVALTEGALIRYFDAEYNKNLKKTFPKSGHKDYSAVYARDLIGAGFDMETTSVGARIGSGGRQHAWAHASVFSLRTAGEKKSLLDLAERADS
jgi:hypothetical protein